MSSFLNSTFQPYIDGNNLQLLIDKSRARFNEPWYKSRFSWAPTSMSLTYTTILGKSRIDAAATIVSRDGRTPIKGRKNVGKLSGSIPVIKTMKKMDEETYRDFLAMQQMSIGTGSDRMGTILDIIYNDVSSVNNSVDKKIDMIVLEGISTGYVTITADNNPGGIVQDTLDLLLPEAQRLGVTVSPDSPDFDFIQEVRNARIRSKNLNKTLGKMLMSEYLFDKILLSKKVAEHLRGFFNPGSNARYTATAESLNEFLRANRLPIIETLDEVVHLTIDDVDHAFRPWKEENIAFIPETGLLGEIKNSYALEEIKPVTQCTYSKIDKKLISKWFQNEPFGEFTKAELNGFPSFDVMDAMFIMETDNVEPFDPEVGKIQNGDVA